MNSKVLNQAYLVIAIATLALLSGVKAQCQILSVSVPALHISSKERIIGFEIHVRSGRIALLPNMPIGWNISVDNDPSWNTVIKGSIDVGAAAMDAEFLRDFIVVEVEKDAPPDMPLDLKGEVIVTSDFSSERRIKLLMKDFAIKGAGVTKTTGRALMNADPTSARSCVLLCCSCHAARARLVAIRAPFRMAR